MDNKNGTNYCICICNMNMFFLVTYFMLYNNILLNSVLLTLNGTHVVVKAQVKKHFCSSEIFIYISDVPLWCGVRMHLTVTKLEYFYKFPIESKVACFMHGLSNCMNRRSCVVLKGTMVICFCMGVVGIVFVWLCLRSVDRIVCLFLATLFLVFGVVYTCISPCRHTSQKPLRKVIIEMSVRGLTLLDNINRVARLSRTPFLICKKEQNDIILNFKIMKYFKTMAYIVGHNPRNWYNFNRIILFNCNFSIYLFNILLIAIKFSNGNTCGKLNVHTTSMVVLSSYEMI